MIDATNVRPEGRKPFVELAWKYHAQLVAVVFNLSAEFCHARNQERLAERPFGPHVIRWHAEDLRRSLGRLEDEGFRRVYVLNTEEEVNAVTFERSRLPVNKRDERGRFDIVGDVHGCLGELMLLLVKLGYRMRRTVDADGGEFWRASHPEGRRLVFVGKDETAAKRWFQVSHEPGIVATRTGRRFFDSPELESEFLALVREALNAAGWWAKFNTDWFALDGELMSWSVNGTCGR